MHPDRPPGIAPPAPGEQDRAANSPSTGADAPRLHYGPSPFTDAVVRRLGQLHAPYRPTPWLPNAHLQLAWLVLREAVAPRLDYDLTETLLMPDGGTIALDWLGMDRGPTRPTLVLLPSITGDAHGSRVIVRDLQRATGWRVVVCTRRGHGDLALTAPRVNTMGCTDDLRAQLARIRERMPASPLYAVGVSAGSGLLVRYLGEEGAASLIRAGVAYCPGYDLAVAWRRVQPLYSRLMARRLQRHFLQRHGRHLAHLGSYGDCLAARDLDGFHRHLHDLAGCVDHEAYLARSNPVTVMRNLRVPVMVLNADDDPVCVAENVREHVDLVRSIPDVLLVRTAHGSHCAFLEGMRPRSWSNRLIAGYLVAAAREQAAAETDRTA